MAVFGVFLIWKKMEYFVEMFFFVKYFCKAVH